MHAAPVDTINANQWEAAQFARCLERAVEIDPQVRAMSEQRAAQFIINEMLTRIIPAGNA